MGEYRITSDKKPTGDQPEAISQLVAGVVSGDKYQTLLGVTGSGKTFTMANVIARSGRPALVLSHNKTLAAQLYQEFKELFPENKVEYFVSYYDYYQPEAYIATTDTYIEKDLAINEDLDKLRLRATMSLMSGRRDVIIVSSVSCLYGIGNPEEFSKGVITVKRGDVITPTHLLRMFAGIQYIRNEVSFDRGNYRVKGDTIDIFPSYADMAYRIIFWGDEIETLQTIDPMNNGVLEELDEFQLYPANIFINSPERTEIAIKQIQNDLITECEELERDGKDIEARRLKERTEYDIEMIREIGYCPGVENYSRYFDGREPGTRPFCLLDYFPKDFLVFIDESHVTLPQIHAMYGGDASRKTSLVDYGFRMKSARDNRPLTFEEFSELVNQVIFVSATPGDYELEQCMGVVVEQVIRPTGLLDPIIDVRPTMYQIDDLLGEIHKRIEVKERTLVTTLTKRMAEELSSFLLEHGIKTAYIHSDVDTLDRIEILDGVRRGDFDVLVGVNMLREGLDLPEVSLVAILDADKEGFLRNERSLTQTVGRAARNLNGMAIMYADKITPSMKKTIDATNARRAKQESYNKANGITPQAIVKTLKNSDLVKTSNAPSQADSIAAEADVLYDAFGGDVEKQIKALEQKMKKAAKELQFIEAAQYRDQIKALKEKTKQ